MIAGWTLIFLIVGAGVAVVVMSWRRRVDTAALGTMSARWIAEHRATEAHYAAR